MNEQIVIQDILKHLAESEYDGAPVSRETIAGVLALSPDQIDRVLRDLDAAELVAPDSLQLTPSGRAYALHVLRAHRLYETYLARKTGVSGSQWHTRAHAKEHQLSSADVDKLARDLDDPRFDPHGDPIPTATGALPPKRGRPLTDYPAGWEGRVVHVEDEPPRLYARIAAAGVAPGTALRVEEKDEREVRVFTEGCAFRFPAEAARQITVVPLMEGEPFDTSVRRLSALAAGEQASVVGLSPLCRDLERSRLLDLGVVPGTVIRVDLVSPSGSPIAYRIRGASIALRREQSERVLIRKATGATHA
jgi:DtxR family Mn-dependent transcriptional regulator